MVEQLKSQIGRKLDRIEYAVFMSAVQPPRPLRQELRTLTNGSETKAGRLVAGLRIADTLVPGIASLLENKINGSRRLPFQNGSTLSFIDEGGDSLVYRLHEQDRVLKLQRVPEDLSLDELSCKVACLSDEHAFVDSLYREIPDLVPPESYLIMQDPFRLISSIGILQPYFSFFNDFFEDFTWEEMRSLTETYPCFKEQLVPFIDKTLCHYDRTSTSMDLGNGRNNLVVLWTSDGPRLKILDCHKKHTPELLAQYPGAEVDYFRHLAYLRFIQREVEYSHYV